MEEVGEEVGGEGCKIEIESLEVARWWRCNVPLDSAAKGGL